MVVVVSVACIVAPFIPAVAQAAAHAGQAATATLTTPSGLALTLSLPELIVVGADIHNNETGVTFDCWKPILRDTSTEPSVGKMFKEIIADTRIKEVIVKEGQYENRPDIRLVNIWDEKFDIQYVMLPTDVLAMHAVQTDSP